MLWHLKTKKYIYFACKRLKIPLLLCSECNLIWVPVPLFTHNVKVEAHQLLEQHPRLRLGSASFCPFFTHFPFSTAIVPFQSCFPPFPFFNHALHLCSGNRQFRAKRHLKQFPATCNTCNYFALNVTLNNSLLHVIRQLRAKCHLKQLSRAMPACNISPQEPLWVN